jgi:hypothetical protein
MAFSYQTFDKLQDQDLVEQLARMDMQNTTKLKLAQEVENQRQNRSQEALRSSQIQDSKSYREALAEDRRVNTETRTKESAARQAELERKTRDERDIRTRAEAIVMDPQSSPEDKQTANAVLLGLKPSMNMTPKPAAISVIREADALKQGTVPAGARIIPDRTKSGGGDGPSPFFTTVQMGDGVYKMNGRTGQLERIGDWKPSAGALDKIAAGEASLKQLDDLKQMFNPDWVGPLKGRFENMQLAIVGERGEKGLAQFQSAISTLQNQVIKDITGAQLSEPEAKRILSQLPDMKLPPDVFMARLLQTEENRAYLLWRQEARSYGRQGQDTFEDYKIWRTQRQKMVQSGGDPAAAAAKAAELINKYGNKGKVK